MQEDGGDGRSDRRHAELGRLLTAAAGYRVLARDGTPLGWLDHVRYERHADHPDEISSAVAVSSRDGDVSSPSARWPKSDNVTGRLWCAAPARSDTRTPSLAQLRRNGWLSVTQEEGGTRVGPGPRIRDIAATWKIELPEPDAPRATSGFGSASWKRANQDFSNTATS